MKTDDWVLLGAIAAAAFILTRKPGAAIAAAPMRTGSVTAGPLTGSSGSRLSPYATGQQLLDAWSRPTSAPVWEWAS